MCQRLDRQSAIPEFSLIKERWAGQRWEGSFTVKQPLMEYPQTWILTNALNTAVDKSKVSKHRRGEGSALWLMLTMQYRQSNSVEYRLVKHSSERGLGPQSKEPFILLRRVQ